VAAHTVCRQLACLPALLRLLCLCHPAASAPVTLLTPHAASFCRCR
jgi:hypothetical protein